MNFDVIHWISTGLSTIAAVLAVIALRSARRQSEPTRLQRCELRLDDHEEQLYQLLARLKRMHARFAARDRRDLEREGTDATRQQQLDMGDGGHGALAMRPGESVADWKQRCRIAIATGGLKHGR